MAGLVVGTIKEEIALGETAGKGEGSVSVDVETMEGNLRAIQNLEDLVFADREKAAGYCRRLSDWFDVFRGSVDWGKITLLRRPGEDAQTYFEVELGLLKAGLYVDVHPVYSIYLELQELWIKTLPSLTEDQSAMRALLQQDCNSMVFNETVADLAGAVRVANIRSLAVFHKLAAGSGPGPAFASEQLPQDAELFDGAASLALTPEGSCTWAKGADALMALEMEHSWDSVVDGVYSKLSASNRSGAQVPLPPPAPEHLPRDVAKVLAPEMVSKADYSSLCHEDREALGALFAQGVKVLNITIYDKRVTAIKLDYSNVDSIAQESPPTGEEGDGKRLEFALGLFAGTLLAFKDLRQVEVIGPAPFFPQRLLDALLDASFGPGPSGTPGEYARRSAHAPSAFPALRKLQVTLSNPSIEALRLMQDNLHGWERMLAPAAPACTLTISGINAPGSFPGVCSFFFGTDPSIDIEFYTPEDFAMRVLSKMAFDFGPLRDKIKAIETDPRHLYDAIKSLAIEYPADVTDYKKAAAELNVMLGAGLKDLETLTLRAPAQLIHQFALAYDQLPPGCLPKLALFAISIDEDGPFPLSRTAKLIARHVLPAATSLNFSVDVDNLIAYGPDGRLSTKEERSSANLPWAPGPEGPFISLSEHSSIRPRR